MIPGARPGYSETSDRSAGMRRAYGCTTPLCPVIHVIAITAVIDASAPLRHNSDSRPCSCLASAFVLACRRSCPIFTSVCLSSGAAWHLVSWADVRHEEEAYWWAFRVHNDVHSDAGSRSEPPPYLTPTLETAQRSRHSWIPRFCGHRPMRRITPDNRSDHANECCNGCGREGTVRAQRATASGTDHRFSGKARTHGHHPYRRIHAHGHRRGTAGGRCARGDRRPAHGRTVRHPPGDTPDPENVAPKPAPDVPRPCPRRVGEIRRTRTSGSSR